MPRARNIKPSFFKNEILIELPFETRLLFIGLWTLADREGRLEDRPKRIKMEIFPADNLDVDSLLSQLNKAGFIQRYVPALDQHDASMVQVNSAYIQIVNFVKHQNPHIKEAKSAIPALDQHHASPADSFLLKPDSLNLIPETPLMEPLVPHGVKEKILLPDWLPKQDWQDWLAMRKKIGKSPTDRALKLAIGELLKFKESGHDPGKILQQSIMNNWAGLFEIKKGFTDGKYKQRHTGFGGQDFYDGTEGFDTSTDTF